MAFPAGFLFGTANADHQVEAHDPEREDVWDLWERSHGLTRRGKATDFWNRYEEDIAAAAGIGCKLFRFSTAWARVEISEGVFDEAALAHYRRVAGCIRRHGMKVMLTLHHFVWPVWLERDCGGMTGERLPGLFERYADRVAEALGDLVDYWITFNEPSQLTFGYIKPWWLNRYYMPPGLPDGADVDAEAEAVGKLVPNLFRANARARAAIKARHPHAKVGVNPLVTGFPTWLQMLMDWGACHRRLSEAVFKFTTSHALVCERGEVQESEALAGTNPQRPPSRMKVMQTASRWLNWAWRFWGTTSLIANANWWYLGISGRLPEELCPAEAVGAQDFVGLDYYWGLPTTRLHEFRALEDAAHGRFIKAPVWPRGLFHALRRFHRWFPGQEVFVVENGSVPQANGVSRKDYLHAHLAEVERAIEHGVPVAGYNFWSITSNREWGHPFDPNTDFGLFFVDLDNDPDLRRVPTTAVEIYREIIRQKRTPPPLRRGFLSRGRALPRRLP